MTKIGNEDVNIVLSDHLNKDDGHMGKNPSGDKNEVRYENVSEVNETAFGKKYLSKGGSNSGQGNSTRTDEKPPLPEKKTLENKKHGTDSKKWVDFQFTGIPPSVQKDDKNIRQLPEKTSKARKRNVDKKVSTRSTQSPEKQNSDKLKKLPVPEKINVKTPNTDSVIYEDLEVDGILPGHQHGYGLVPEHFPEERAEADYDLIDPSDMMKT